MQGETRDKRGANTVPRQIWCLYYTIPVDPTSSQTWISWTPQKMPPRSTLHFYDATKLLSVCLFANAEHHSHLAGIRHLTKCIIPASG